ncbi:MAG: hypothetical protein QG597_3746 [Actinomycetota bacterium]|nr:hypothetical protein [Actinomycetota bacterium]
MASDPTAPSTTGGTSLWVRVLAVVGALSLLAAAVLGGVLGVSWLERQRTTIQNDTAFTPFYTAPAEVPPTPGVVIRSEPLGFEVAGGSGYRFVYTSVDGGGRTVPVSGMVFLPERPAPAAGGRKVLAYAHGTVGTAAKCAPSRATSMGDLGIGPWLDPALDQGWVVVATDYVGLGIPATSTYLLGDQEARDVVNSVRAARDFPGAEAGADWIVYGSSQGGNSALWTADLASDIAPELNLVGVMAAVPAAQLGATVAAQWNTPAAWALGPAILSSWTTAYPDADFEATLTPEAKAALPGLQSACIIENAIEALVRGKLGQRFFSTDPTTDPAWIAGIEQQTPPIPPSQMPMLLAQGTADEVVLAGSNALLQDQWCRSRPMTSLWLGGVSHQDTSTAAGPAAVNWAAQRFAGAPAVDTCAFGVPAPVQPLPNPVPRP